ncbi:MAG: XRE family transcriptional regulator [Microbacterium sp.]|uniref:helix-turn-helix domain-containing protein n=2 Tax=Microbacteriaceae TaxID=85023 RepID=UPI0012C94656|nr:XRE family transcriptional regulator [Microbacterium sp.]
MCPKCPYDVDMETQQQNRVQAVKRQMDAEVGRRVHMLMWDQQLTQTAFGARVGIDQSALAKKLRGQRGWSLDEVATVAAELGVSVSYLFGEGEGVGPAGIEPTTSTV